MLNFARLSEKERRDVFRAAAQSKKINEAIIEKDFWVCWVLDYLFHSSPWKNKMIFKGGTSLSKAYHAIERFSEDIDLILDWRLLGYSPDEPRQDRSRNKQNEFNESANQRCAAFLKREFLPILIRSLEERSETDIKIDVREQDVLIHYPHSFMLASILPQIKLEIGPLAAWTPSEKKIISPYVAEELPGIFAQPTTAVTTITAERTFWEKATILHQEAHRPPPSPLPQHYSRHYYDLCRLSRSPVRDKALSQLALLAQVVAFKTKFYWSSWARYQEATPGSLRLSPPSERISDLSKDYQSMQPMLFGNVPEFNDILADIAELENAVNKK